jgi:DNA repair protein RecO (recombination protein O)
VAEHRTRALVLRTFDQGESDRIVHLYTEALGRVSAIAKGARRSRRRFPGTLEILTVIEVQLVDRPRAGLARLDGTSLIRSFEPLVSDLGRYAIACELVEILARFTGEREASPDLFHFAVGVLDVLGSERPDRFLGLLVLIKTLARLGYRPALVRCSLCGRSLGSGQRVGFAARHGGAVCAECAAPEDPRVPGRILAALEAGIGRPLRERHTLGLRGSDVALVESLTDRFFQFHLGARLRSSAFVRRVVPAESLDGGGKGGDTAPAPRERRPREPRAGPADLPPPLRGSP